LRCGCANTVHPANKANCNGISFSSRSFRQSHNVPYFDSNNLATGSLGREEESNDDIGRPVDRATDVVRRTFGGACGMSMESSGDVYVMTSSWSNASSMAMECCEEDLVNEI
jgi:hypothetical protein